MEDYSHALVLEGDYAPSVGGLRVHVVPPLAPKRTLLVRKLRDRAREQRESSNALRRLLREPDGVARFIGGMLGGRAVDLLRAHPNRLEETRADLLGRLQQLRGLEPPKPTEHWALATGYQGVERAEVVVVNVRSHKGESGAARLLADLARIRKEPDVFADVLGALGSRIPITSVAADLADAQHPGTRKAVGRIKRSMRED
jgi:hypothetical protein